MKSTIQMTCSLAIILLCSALLSGAQQPAPIKEIKIPKGETIDLWVGVNVSGKLHYVIKTSDGKGTLRMWWIIQPFGRVTQLGNRGGVGTLEIPAKLQGSIYAKLRAKASVDTIIDIGENVSVDNSMTFNW